MPAEVVATEVSLPAPRIKICGVTTPDDARAVADLGAHLIGLNLYDGPRRITATRAAEILKFLPASVAPVVLLAAPDGRVPPDVRRLTDAYGIIHLQLYGPVAPGVIRTLNADGFHAIYTAGAMDASFVADVQRFLDGCGDSPPAAVMLDGASADRGGGTGRRADWQAIGRTRDAGAMNGWPSIWLAGGLRPDNVAEAIRLVRPDVVDVSSGVESSPGRKDPSVVGAFVASARVVPP